VIPCRDMSSLISSNSSGQPISVPSIGADVTLLLAAASFINDFDRKSDPKAREAFIAVASAYCNRSDLILPLPRQEVEKVPLFYDLWHQREALIRVPDVELSDDTFDSIAAQGATHFATYAEGEAWDVGRWICFQFTPAIADYYLDRADCLAVKRCGSIAKTLLETGRVVQLQRAINSLQEDKLINAPRVYEDLVGAEDIPSFLHLCIAYALSVSLRGYSYALALSQRPSAPLYRHHWVRSPIVRRIGSFDIPAEIKSESMVQFPWGEILQRVFDPVAPAADRNPRLVAEILDGIRERSNLVRNEMQQGLLSNLTTAGTGDRITDAEEFVLKLLGDVGVPPRYANSNFLQRAVGWLRDISSKNLLFKIPVDLITTNLQPALLRRTESAMRMRFKRDSFWKVMEDPGIRQTLHLLRSNIPERI